MKAMEIFITVGLLMGIMDARGVLYWACLFIGAIFLGYGVASMSRDFRNKKN